MAGIRIRVTLINAFVALLGLFSFSAQAAIVQVGAGGMSQGPYLVEDFEDSTLVPGLTTNGQFPFSACSAANCVTPSGSSGALSVDFPAVLTFSFATPASSVGMWFGNDDVCCAQSVTAMLDIFGTSGLLGSISVLANMNDDADQFIGFTSAEQVVSVGLRYLDNQTGGPASLFIYVDDLQFNTSNVPEPGSLALVTLALAGAVALRGRRRA